MGSHTQGPYSRKSSLGFARKALVQRPLQTKDSPTVSIRCPRLLQNFTRLTHQGGTLSSEQKERYHLNQNRCGIVPPGLDLLMLLHGEVGRVIRPSAEEATSSCTSRLHIVL